MNRLILQTLALVTMMLVFGPAGAGAQDDIVLVADMAVDGQGNVLQNPVIVIRGNTIASVSSGGSVPSGADVVDLTGYTILPGLIDAHVHITANFDPGAARPKLALHGARNSESVLMHGFTTVRSLGGPDFAAVDLRDAIEEGLVPGPRLQVSSEWARDDILAGAEGPRVAAGERPANEREIRTWVRGKAAAGVDWIKVLATRSSRVGGTPLYSQEQLNWFMDEARSQGKPVSAHAHAAEGVRRAVLAGARTIEHGALMNEAAMDLMVEQGTYYSPNLFLGEYYIAHADEMGYTGAAIEFTRDFLPPRTAVFTTAVEKGVKIVFGTDANRGWLWEGNTALEFQRRNVAGQSERDAVISATSLAAEVLMVDDRGDLQEGMLADVIAVRGNPLTDIKSLMNVVFVMKDGEIYREPEAEARPRT